MPTRVITNEMDRKLLLRYIATQKLPFSISLTKGRRRTYEQNRLQRLWLSEGAEQLGDRTAEELRGEMKLTIGVPILRAENEDFRTRYDAVVRPLSYEQKLALMMEPLDMPVTRLMTTDQKTRFLDQMAQKLLEQGVVLTDPERRYAA